MEIGFTGGRVLTRGGFADGTAWLSAGRFAVHGAGRCIDATGLWLLPGAIDLHGDAFERHVAPRRGLVLDMVPAMPVIEREIAASGITTAWLAQFWSWEGGMRGPEFARALLAALDAARPGLRLDMRVQLRLETHMLDDAGAVLDLIAAHRLGYLVFNDHLPHDRLSAGLPPPRLQGSAAKARRSPGEHQAIMQALEARTGEVPGFLAALAPRLAAAGVRLGSHDDETAETRARYGALGAAICEFPTTRAAAEAARARGEHVVMGAPNVVRGASHNRGGVSAESLIADGLVDALASDYHYPSLVVAAFALVDRGILDFPQAWALVSAGPAQVLGLTDRGHIAEGMRGDLVLLDPNTRRIEGCFAAGRPVWLSGALADRVLGRVLG
ncbi:alpha-D-ribose 1-methylphosphonate 5-triphosphate diphosphatase [Anianabacter salinae]|uniref:alpha-D-ribose 1-methylphosphonate 5-triphosphate diphosphatase n=1 Tax=Anianabacter salinae TaxID=2851023 RepID=UPI00225E4826|nr:alpha-D-ribose 1-methylphosphonate 5-triphosphate diphosphatase [Anianabacter salinae]MBV0911998.1 alpha-D-ribose 1-methylphosphonate 5-triphosphate diphosphatase [Anianabacter salinae]